METKNEFTIMHNEFLDGIKQENPFYISFKYYDPQTHNYTFGDTRRSLRFATENDAQNFCDCVLSTGEISMENVSKAEAAAWDRYYEGLEEKKTKGRTGVKFKTTDIPQSVSPNFVFTLKRDDYLDGERQEKPFYLSIQQTDPVTYNTASVVTQRSHRFYTQSEAERFCDDVVAGKIKVADIFEEEVAAWKVFYDKEHEELMSEVNPFLDKASQLGLTPDTLYELTRAYNSLSQDAKTFLEDKETMQDYYPEQPQQRSPITFGEYLDLHKKDMDVCILSLDENYYSRPATCYLPEELMSRKHNPITYSEEEQWQRTLPVMGIDDSFGSDTVILGSNLSGNETSFLLDVEDFSDPKWEKLSIRATWAGAGFEERLAFLKEGKPFEISFDGHCMDVEDPEMRSVLCEMLANNKEVYIATYLHVQGEAEYYAYPVFDDPNSKDIETGYEVPIKHTEPGKGLTSTVEGKIACAKHDALKQQNDQPEPGISKDSPDHERD